ncbi:transposase [Neptuniibacter sp. UBA6509]|uniref:transposase n=2 Tax=unclassified Neptuniibacter TaxID=2630693 RepID=UPI0025DB3F52|nr:transposase [Neptuniibacter sp. UBA6509]|tara:strand:+ start:2931 stop:3296 length:366 start_codon:yes stop_codon:yes gene_type:complete
MPKYTQPRKTWQYSNEFKAKAVQLTYLDDVKVKDVAATLDIHPFMLSRWRKELREGLKGSRTKGVKKPFNDYISPNKKGLKIKSEKSVTKLEPREQFTMLIIAIQSVQITAINELPEHKRS